MRREPYLHPFFHRDRSTEPSPISPWQRTWANLGITMILRAVKDAVAKEPEKMPSEYEAKRLRYEKDREYTDLLDTKRNALWWLLEDDQGFPFWCDLAGLDWKVVRSGCRRSLRHGQVWRTRDKMKRLERAKPRERIERSLEEIALLREKAIAQREYRASKKEREFDSLMEKNGHQ
jgi:hypothetical protein